MIERVSFTASSAWQILIEKRQGRHTVAPFNDSKQSLRRLIFDLVDVLSSDYHEVANAGVRTINSLMGKIFTKLMEETLSILHESFEGVDEKTSSARFNYFLHLIEACDENIGKFRKPIEEVIGKMIIHDNPEVKRLSSEVFKAFRKILLNENFVRDFIRDNFCTYDDKDDSKLLEKKMTFLEALIGDPYLGVSPILTNICLNPKDTNEAQYYSRAKLLRLVSSLLFNY